MGYGSQISWSGSEASWLPMSCILAGRGAGQAGCAARSLENMCNSWISAITSFLKQVHHTQNPLQNPTLFSTLIPLWSQDQSALCTVKHAVTFSFM